MTNNDGQEKRVDDFLRQHEPVAPERSPFERARIFAAVEQETKPKNTAFRWSIAALLAVAFTGLALQWFQKNNPSIHAPAPIAAATVEKQYVDDSYDDEDDFEEVGYEYIELAQTISQ